MYISEAEFTLEHIEEPLSVNVLETWPLPNEFTDVGDYTQEWRGHVSTMPSHAALSARARRVNAHPGDHIWRQYDKRLYK